MLSSDPLFSEDIKMSSPGYLGSWRSDTAQLAVLQSKHPTLDLLKNRTTRHADFSVPSMQEPLSDASITALFDAAIRMNITWSPYRRQKQDDRYPPVWWRSPYHLWRKNSFSKYRWHRLCRSSINCASCWLSRDPRSAILRLQTMHPKKSLPSIVTHRPVKLINTN